MLILYFHNFPLFITVCTIIIKFFNILVVVEMLVKISYHLSE